MGHIDAAKPIQNGNTKEGLLLCVVDSVLVFVCLCVGVYAGVCDLGVWCTYVCVCVCEHACVATYSVGGFRSSGRVSKNKRTSSH